VSSSQIREYLATALSTGPAGLVDEAFVRHYEEEAPNLLGALVAQHPARESILRKCVTAHKRGDYELSVPVFLAQADGICVELTKLNLYAKKKITGSGSAGAAYGGVRPPARRRIIPSRAARALRAPPAARHE
jgi:hypothetical protein